MAPRSSSIALRRAPWAAEIVRVCLSAPDTSKRSPWAEARLYGQSEIGYDGGVRNR